MKLTSFRSIRPPTTSHVVQLARLIEGSVRWLDTYVGYLRLRFEVLEDEALTLKLELAKRRPAIRNVKFGIGGLVGTRVLVPM
jgi:hypothetical protein